MLIAVFGDAHIGAGVDDDIKDALQQIHDQLLARNPRPDLIIVTGDLFDGQTTPVQRQLAAEYLNRLSRLCPVGIIKGNHDPEHENELFGMLRTEIRYFPEYACFSCGENVAHILPWINRGAWIAAHPELSVEESAKSLGALAADFLRVRVAMFPELKHYLFGHLTVDGARAENHQPLIGEGVTIGPHDLLEIFHGGVLGHIHLQQIITNPSYPGRSMVYPGSIAAMNYGETSNLHAYAILDTDSGAIDICNLQCPRRLIYDALWDGSLTLDMGEETLESISNDYIKVRIVLQEGYRPEDARKAVRERIPQCRELKIEMQLRPKEQVRAPEVSRSAKASDKMIGYWKATGTTPDEPKRQRMLDKVNYLEELWNQRA